MWYAKSYLSRILIRTFQNFILILIILSLFLRCEAIEHVAFLVKETDQDQQMDDSNSFGENMVSRLHISTNNTTSRGKKIVSFNIF